MCPQYISANIVLWVYVADQRLVFADLRDICVNHCGFVDVGFIVQYVYCFFVVVDNHAVNAATDEFTVYVSGDGNLGSGCGGKKFIQVWVR